MSACDIETANKLNATRVHRNSRKLIAGDARARFYSSPAAPENHSTPCEQWPGPYWGKPHQVGKAPAQHLQCVNHRLTNLCIN